MNLMEDRMAHSAQDAAHLIDAAGGAMLDIMGPMIALVTPPVGSDDAPCVMRGIIPPGGCVPLHSHADPETFIGLAGEMEGIAGTAAQPRWLAIGPGDIFHAPGGARHAFRNCSRQAAVAIAVGTVRLARFFQEVGAPITGTAPPPCPERLNYFLATAARYGYWNATPEENECIGLHLPALMGDDNGWKTWAAN